MASLALDVFFRSIGAAIRETRRGASTSITIEFDAWLRYRRFGRGRPRLVFRIDPSWRRMFSRPACRHIKVSCDPSDNGIPRLEIDGRLIELPDRHASEGTT